MHLKPQTLNHVVFAQNTCPQDGHNVGSVLVRTPFYRCVFQTGASFQTLSPVNPEPSKQSPYALFEDVLARWSLPINLLTLKQIEGLGYLGFKMEGLVLGFKV